MMSRLCAVSIALIAILQLQNGHMWISAENLNPVCNTTECQKLGKYYLQNIDPLTHPCNDFYDYVCSNWGIHNPRPKDMFIQFLWNVHNNLEVKTTEDMRKLLESKTSSRSSDFEQAKLLYRTCMSTPYMGRNSPSAVWNVMKKIAAFPVLLPRSAQMGNRPFFWEIEQVYIETTGESALFDFYPVALDRATKTEIITNLKPLRSSYGSLVRPVGWPRRNELESYKAFLYKLIKSMVEPEIKVNKEVVETDIHHVIQFREKLNTIIAAAQSSNKTEIVTIKRFQSWYSGQAQLLPNVDINWLSVISGMYKKADDSSKFSITEASRVRVNVNYFAELVGLLAETKLRTIVNHIHLFFAERHVEWTPSMTADLSASVAGTGTNGLIESIDERWNKCMFTNNLRIAMAKEYARVHFPATKKAKVTELFETMKKTLGMRISQTTWLDAATKKATLRKLAAAKASLGYPDWFDATGPTNSTVLFPDPLLADERFLRDENRIVFSAPVLQSPVYTLNGPDVVNYGSLGSQFGHELHHMFDVAGIKFDENGKTPFWPEPMRTRHQEKSMCFLKHYGKYKHQEVQHLKLDNAQTLLEDMADAMGLKLAYLAFKEMLKKNKGVCPILPGFETFGCEKLFFIAYASDFCGVMLPGYNELMWFRQSRNLPQIRVNAAVATMNEFTTAFKCRPADSLHAKDTCDLWSP